MTDYLAETRDELNSKVESLIDLFADYDFELNGQSKDQIEDMDGLLKLLGQTKRLPNFESFRKQIKAALTSDFDSDLDWDDVETKYDDLRDEYKAYCQVMEQVLDNLTGSQSLSGARIYDKEQIKDYLYALFESRSEFYDIDTPDGVKLLLGAELENAIDQEVGFE